MAEHSYEHFLKSPLEKSWRRIGVHRRAGILAPLFSILSRNSIGVGEFPDLEKLGDWCRACGLSIIQLLPLNDVGGRFCPYDAESSFALEPMHLNLEDLEGVSKHVHAEEAARLRQRFPLNVPWFDTRIKQVKIDVLKSTFLTQSKKKLKSYNSFLEQNEYWLPDYALYKVIKRSQGEKPWEAWPEPLKNHESAALDLFGESHQEELDFECWLQWQLAGQFHKTADALRKKKILLMGDLPFLVSRDSADVWAHREYFKLDLSSGAPPDLYFEHGQEWGMPPYNWEFLAEHRHDYFREKLRFASQFYDLYRVDHFVGLFRIWVFPRQGGENRKAEARFDPVDESLWEAQAKRILDAMIASSPMLPCAEDLGTVPDMARTLLKNYAVPGMDVQRWMRDWEGTKDYIPPKQYRPNSVATLSTHDMEPFETWWRTESTEDDRRRFKEFAEIRSDSPGRVLRAALEMVNQSASIFSIQSFQDWLLFAGILKESKEDLRINRPGIVDDRNWRLRVPSYLEDWKASKGTKAILGMVRGSEREC